MSTTTPRGTRSRTRALSRFSDGSPPAPADEAAQSVDGDSLVGEEEWEDMTDVSDIGDRGAGFGRPSSTIRRAPGNTRRRRKALNQHTPVRKATSRSDTPTSGLQQVKREDGVVCRNDVASPELQVMPEISTAKLVGGAVQGVSFGSYYIFDVIRTALALLRKPLGVILFLWILAFILSTISATLRAAFAPICWLPFISSSAVCRPLPEHVPRKVDFPRLMETQTKSFETLLDETVGGSSLSLEVKKAELATSDLVTLVRYSSLESKENLASHLQGFMQSAKTTAKRLQRLHSKVGGSVDDIMSVNLHALRTLEEANIKRSIFSLDTIIPWSKKRKDEIVASTFGDAMDTLSAQLKRLIIEAEANLGNLNDLEEQLITLHDLVSRDTKIVTADYDEIMANLWTFLGANKDQIKSFKENLSLLKDVGKYRKHARVHVVAALHSLQSLSEDMQDLRERVATPGLVGENIPLEVQMESIQLGLRRLQDNRLKARQMEEAAVRKTLGHDFDELEG